MSITGCKYFSLYFILSALPSPFDRFACVICVVRSTLTTWMHKIYSSIGNKIKQNGVFRRIDEYRRFFFFSRNWSLSVDVWHLIGAANEQTRVRLFMSDRKIFQVKKEIGGNRHIDSIHHVVLSTMANRQIDSGCHASFNDWVCVHFASRNGQNNWNWEKMRIKEEEGKMIARASTRGKSLLVMSLPLLLLLRHRTMLDLWFSLNDKKKLIS